MVSGAVVPGGVSGDLGPRLRKFPDPALNAVLSQVGEIRPERVCLDSVYADVEEGLVQRSDDIGPGDVEYLVAALMSFEVVEAQIVGLQHGPRCTIGNDDTAG